MATKRKKRIYTEEERKLLKEIREKYSSGQDEISFSGITNIKRYFPNATVDLIKDALSGIDTYTLFREPKFPKFYNPIYVHKPRELIQADLIDLQKLSNTNDDYKYLLALIDSFTRFAWIRPLKNKSGATVLKAFKDIVENDMKGNLGKAFLADQGTEFINSDFKAYLRSKGTENRIANNKAPHIERFNRSFQNLIFRFLEDRETERYIDNLYNLLEIYNSRYHRTIKMSPKMAELEENLETVQKNVEDYYKQAVGNKKRNKRNLPLKEGDLVRISKHRNPFYKGYYQSFLPKIYEVSEVLRNLPIVMYKIKDKESGVMESGTWYAQELQRVSEDSYDTDTLFKIEKIIKWRGKGKKREALIKWKYWPEKYNSWEPEEAIQSFHQNESAQSE